ncbi:MAG: Txe/YoeB family addiction module toxin [Slackia sp.]|nr:Txe/YoeB family addiction module toxin [Slackia sp.]
MMNKVWTDDAWDDYLWWQKNDRKTLKRINALVKDIERSPFEGIGKPEPLRHNYAGMWSRRIDILNRIIYEVRGNDLRIHSVRDYYSDK